MNDEIANVAFSADALRAGYEQLRDQALGSSSGGLYRGFGFALLVRAGLTAWLLACRESLSGSPQPAKSSASLQAPSPSGLRAEITMILTAMALGDGKATA